MAKKYPSQCEEGDSPKKTKFSIRKEVKTMKKKEPMYMKDGSMPKTGALTPAEIQSLLKIAIRLDERAGYWYDTHESRAIEISNQRDSICQAMNIEFEDIHIHK